MILLILVPSTLKAVPEILVRAVAAKSGGVNEAMLPTGSAVSLVDQAGAGSITAPTFGFSAVAMEGSTKVNGTWTITSFTYSRWINGSPALDGNGNPLLDKPFGTFNAVGGAGPDIRGLTTTGAQSVGNGTATSGVTLNTTHSVLVSQFVASIDGSVRRPFLGAPGSNYTIEFRVSGTFNGVSFTKSATAIVIVGLEVVWADLRSDGQWSNGSDWVCPPSLTMSGETGFVQGVRMAPNEIGQQYILLGWESSTDMGQTDPWASWPSVLAAGTIAPDGSGILNLRAVNGMSGFRRFFRLKYQKVEAPAPTAT